MFGGLQGVEVKQVSLIVWDSRAEKVADTAGRLSESGKFPTRITGSAPRMTPALLTNKQTNLPNRGHTLLYTYLSSIQHTI